MTRLVFWYRKQLFRRNRGCSTLQSQLLTLLLEGFFSLQLLPTLVHSVGAMLLLQGFIQIYQWARGRNRIKTKS